LKTSLLEKIVPSKDVLTQEVSGEMVLMDLSSEQYFGLDAIGTRVWNLLDQGTAPVGLLSILLREYEVEQQQLESDIEELLGQLLEAGLVRVGEEGMSAHAWVEHQGVATNDRKDIGEHFKVFSSDSASKKADVP